MKIYHLDVANTVRVFETADELIDSLEKSNRHINDMIDMVNARQDDHIPVCISTYESDDQPKRSEIGEWYAFNAESCTYQYMTIKDAIARRKSQWSGANDIDITNWGERIKRWANTDIKRNNNTINSIKANKPVKSDYICLVEKLGEYKYSIKVAYHEDVFCTTCIRYIGTGQSMERHTKTEGHIKVANNRKAHDNGMIEINPATFKTLNNAGIVGSKIPMKYKYLMPKWAATAYDLYKKNNKFGKMSLADYLKTIADGSDM